MQRDFRFETSRLAYDLFAKTGKVCYYQLFKAVEFGRNIENQNINEIELSQ